MIALDREERELSESVEKGGWRSVPDMEDEMRRSEAYARATFEQNTEINIRISQKDLNDLKMRANEEGIPHHILVSGIIRKYLSGRLAEMV